MSNRKNKKKSSDLLPENCQLEICGASGFGDLMAAAIDPTDNPHGYKIYVLENKKIKPALAEGDRFIARLSRKNDTWWAKPLARTMTAGVALEQIYGVIVEKTDCFISARPKETPGWTTFWTSWEAAVSATLLKWR